jgi:iron complex transport system ATP-binding protein
VAVEAKDIHHSFGGTSVLRGVSFSARPGRVTALVGPNGAGKSTMLRIALGVLTPDRGRVRVGEGGGVDPAALTDPQRAAMIAFVPQRASVAFGFSVREVVGFGAPGRERAAEIDSVLECLSLEKRAEELFGHLSAGQQQRATLARAIVQLRAMPGPARVLLADEPVSAMDPRHAIDAMALLSHAASQGAAVLVVLHDLTLARRYCDDAVVLGRDGLVRAAGAVAEVLTPETLEPVFGVRFESARTSSGAEVLTPMPRSDRIS